MDNAFFATSSMTRLAAVTETGNPWLCQRFVGSTLPYRPGTSHLSRNGGGWPPGLLTMPCALSVRCLDSGVCEAPVLRDQLGHW